MKHLEFLCILIEVLQREKPVPWVVSYAEALFAMSSEVGMDASANFLTCRRTIACVPCALEAWVFEILYRWCVK